ARQRYVSRPGGLPVEVQDLGSESSPADILDPPQSADVIGRRREAQDRTPVLGYGERNVRPRECQPANPFVDVLVLGALAAHEFPPAGRVIEEIANFDGRTRGMGAGCGVAERS